MNIRHTANCLLLILLVSCMHLQPPPVFSQWTLENLRGLDAVDAPLPTQDMIALYTRTTSQELQIRLDFLDLAPIPDYDLYLVLDTIPGGRRDLPIKADADLEWDTLLIIPMRGNLQSLDSSFRPRDRTGLLIMRDPSLDTLTLSLNWNALSLPDIIQAENASYRLQVFLTPTNSTEISDKFDPVITSGLPPLPVRVLFTFWNTYPAYTPATALRRWDGAHTGPLGGSHGLFHLLRSARRAKIPLVLLDLKNPAALSAMDFAGNLGLVKEMVSQDGLIIPEYLPDLINVQNERFDPLADQILAQNRGISQRFDLPNSPFATAPPGKYPVQSGIKVIFSRLNPTATQTTLLKPTYISRWRDQRLIPIFMNYDFSMQATLEGPALDVRQALIDTARKTNQVSSITQTPILNLGGDLSSSTWGVAPMARATFYYLKEHPWIQILTASDLLASNPTTEEEKFSEKSASSNETNGNNENKFYSPYQPAISIVSNTEILKELQNCPLRTVNHDAPETLCEAAWQAYLALFAPVYRAPSELAMTRARYVEQVWSLLEGASWAATPSPRATCDIDPDRDGQPECILSSTNFYAQFEIESGSLNFAFIREGHQGGATRIHQLIAPSSQFITGLQNPSTWDWSSNLSLDPAVIAGAFYESGKTYQVSTEPERLVFTSSDGQLMKICQLTPLGLRVDYRFLLNAPFITTQIPLALDPWQRFYPGWIEKYNAIMTSDGWNWHLTNGPSVKIQTNAVYSIYTFKDSYIFLSIPEDPNRDYPPGHFLPFPMALMEINSGEDFTVKIDLIPSQYVSIQ